MKVSMKTYQPKLTLKRTPKRTSKLGGLFLSMLLSAAATPIARADAIKSYQVTGPVLEVTDSSITVAKDKEKWQIARDKDTKITGDLKVGAKVTIQYRMAATAVEVKGAGKGAAAADAKPAKDKAAKK